MKQICPNCGTLFEGSHVCSKQIPFDNMNWLSELNLECEEDWELIEDDRILCLIYKYIMNVNKQGKTILTKVKIKCNDGIIIIERGN